MQIKPREPDDLALKEFVTKVANWRAGRKLGSRIPAEIWDQAAALAKEYGVSRVSNGAGLDWKKIKRLSGPPVARNVEPSFIRVAPVNTKSSVPPKPFKKKPVVIAELSTREGLLIRIFEGIDAKQLEQLTLALGGAL